MTLREHYKKNFILAWPVTVSQVGHIMVAVADSVMVGRLGSIPLAAVSLANGIFAVIMVFGIGLAFGITPLIANADGAKSHEKISPVVQAGFWINTFAGLILFLMVLAGTYLLPYLGQDPEVVQKSTHYLRILGFSMLPFLVFFTFKQYAEGLSNTREAMYITVSVNLLNVLLNYLLIFGKWGFPALGIDGAGYATLISRVVMAFAMYVFVKKAKLFSHIPLNLKLIGVQWNQAKQILKIGIPTGLQYIFEVSAFAMAAVFIGMVSATQLAAHQIALNLASITYMAATGLAATATIRMGNQLGMKSLSGLKLALKTIIIMTIGIMGLSGIVLLIFHKSLPYFYTDEVAVTAIASTLIIVAVFFQISDGLQAVALGALRGMADVKIPTYITLAVYWGLALPGAYLFGVHWGYGALAVWYFLASGLTLSALLLLWRIKRKVKALGKEM